MADDDGDHPAKQAAMAALLEQSLKRNVELRRAWSRMRQTLRQLREENGYLADLVMRAAGSKGTLEESLLWSEAEEDGDRDAWRTKRDLLGPHWNWCTVDGLSKEALLGGHDAAAYTSTPLVEKGFLEKKRNAAKRPSLSVAASPSKMRKMLADTSVVAVPVETIDGGEDVAAGKVQKRRRSSQTNLTAAKKRQVLTELAKDEDGNVIVPAVVASGKTSVVILDFGTVIWERPAFHSARFLYPVGFKSQRIVGGTVAATATNTLANNDTALSSPANAILNREGASVFTCEILDGGDAPVFQITASQLEDRVFQASSPSGVWKLVLDELAAKNMGSTKTNASGPDYFGLSSPLVLQHIQNMPGAAKCTRYQRFPRLKANKGAGSSNAVEGAQVELLGSPEAGAELVVDPEEGK